MASPRGEGQALDRAAGYRVYRRFVYTSNAVRIVRFAKRAQELGCGLDQVEVLLGLATGGPDDGDAARHLATAMIIEVDGRIASLRAMRACLERLVDTCSRPRAERECPLLHTVDVEPTSDQNTAP